MTNKFDKQKADLKGFFKKTESINVQTDFPVTKSR